MSSSHDKDKACDLFRVGSEYRLRIINPEIPLRVGDCRDCGHLVGHISLWCGSKEAYKEHETNLPSRDDCKFWTAPPLNKKKSIVNSTKSFWQRLFGK